MFEDKTSQTNQTNISPADSNQDKSFPFKKVGESDKRAKTEKKLAGNKGPVEDIFYQTESNNKPTGTIEPEEQNQTIEEKSRLKETPIVPSMTGQIGNKKLIRIGQNSNGLENKEINIPLVLPEDTGMKSRNKIFLIVIIILIMASLSLAGVFAYKYFSQSRKVGESKNANEGLNELLEILETQKHESTESTEAQQDKNIETPLNPAQGKQEQNNKETSEEDLRAYEMDSDKDGLKDEQEIDLGTNPYKFDTDSDGLNDFEEVEVYHSNPVLPDTDGDGYEDGNEVENGYDPLKSGKARL